MPGLCQWQLGEAQHRNAMQSDAVVQTPRSCHSATQVTHTTESNCVLMDEMYRPSQLCMGMHYAVEVSAYLCSEGRSL